MDPFNSTAFKQSNSLIDKVRKILKKKQKKIIGRKIMKENKKQKIRLTEVKKKYANSTKKKIRKVKDWDSYWNTLTKKQQRNLSRRQSHSISSLMSKMEKMENLFGASILTNIRFPNGSQQSLYTLKVGESIKFVETEEGKFFIECFQKFFRDIQKKRRHNKLMKNRSKEKDGCVGVQRLKRQLQKHKYNKNVHNHQSERVNDSDENEDMPQEQILINSENESDGKHIPKNVHHQERFVPAEHEESENSDNEIVPQERLVPAEHEESENSDSEFEPQERFVPAEHEESENSDSEFEPQERFVLAEHEESENSDSEFEPQERFVLAEHEESENSDSEFEPQERIVPAEHEESENSDSEFEPQERFVPAEHGESENSDNEIVPQERFVPAEHEETENSDNEIVPQGTHSSKHVQQHRESSKRNKRKALAEDFVSFPIRRRKRMKNDKPKQANLVSPSLNLNPFVLLHKLKM